MAVLICPICSESRFDSLESLRLRLLTAATQKISCPICTEDLMGLDKFTIHLFGHALSQDTQTPLHEKCVVAQEEALCTVNMEDLNFLTSWDVSCKTGIKNEPTGDVSQNKHSIQPLHKPVEIISENRLLSSFKSNCCSNNFDNPSKTGDQQELLLEIQPKPPDASCGEANHQQSHQIFGLEDSCNIEQRPKLLSTYGISLVQDHQRSEMNLPERKNFQESHPHQMMAISEPLKELQSELLPATTVVQPGDLKPCDERLVISPDFLSAISEFRHHSPPVLSESSSSGFVSELFGHKESISGWRKSEESRIANMPDSPLGGTVSSPGGISNESGELSEYMSNLLQQKLPASSCTMDTEEKINSPLTCKVEAEAVLQSPSHVEAAQSAPNPFPCELCGRAFKMRGSLLVHTRVAHGGGLADGQGDSASPEKREFHCSLCTKSFKKEQHLTQHMKTHDGKQWQCETCSKYFTTKYFLKKHQRLHTGEMPYSCETCKKTFTFQQSYHKHLLYHSTDKPHECAECGRAFKELSTLHNHQRIHSGEKPFACEACGKCFRQRVSYIVHQRIHTGVLPYQCTACKKKFRYKVSQRSHKCTVQPPGVVIRQPGDLIQRILEHRQNVLQCLE